jgi:hypothetical protein
VNGVSKKLCISLIGIQALVHLAPEDPSRVYYGLMVMVIVVVFKLVQCRIDVIKSKFGKQERNEENKNG